MRAGRYRRGAHQTVPVRLKRTLFHHFYGNHGPAVLQSDHYLCLFKRSKTMASTGSVSAWDEALLVAMIQYPVPVIKGPADIQVQVDQICKAVDSTKAGYPDLDLIVMPEY